MELERDWYGVHWRSLRRNLVKLCVNEAQPFFDALQSGGDEIEQVATVYFEQLMAKISKRVPNDRLGMWQNALPLLENTEQFADRVAKDLDALRGEMTRNGKQISPKQALGNLLRQFFELARREFAAREKGVKADRIKRWESLDRVSRKVAAQPPITDARCTDKHFADVSVYIKTNHPKDRNLPRKISTIRQYFLEFSDTCLELGVDEAFGAATEIATEVWADAASGQETDILEALAALSAMDRAILDLECDTNLGDVRYMSKDAFMREHQLDEAMYAARLQEVRERALPLIEHLAKQVLDGGEQ